MSIAPAINDWFAANGRDLPWRRAGFTAWGTLVSEFILQQTPVARVIPRLEEWLIRWPTPADLAAVPSGDAVRAWGRLGYPRRALNLHATAVAITERHGGMVPHDVDQLLALPGIGDYTARAVLAFAFGQRHPVVDVNVRRLVARAVTGVADGGSATSPADLKLVETLLPAAADRAARASAAFMELGALVCVARTPRCTQCPLARQCAWLLAGAPAAEGPARRPQGYAGTDRQVRGLLLAVLRESASPVPGSRLDVVWPEPVQRDRALASLLADGLVTRHGSHYGLAGDIQNSPFQPTPSLD